MTAIAIAIDHLDKPMGRDHADFIHHALAAEFVETGREQFERFVATVNYRRDLIAGIRKYFLVSTGKLVAFYINEWPGRFFIEPIGCGVRHI